MLKRKKIEMYGKGGSINRSRRPQPRTRLPLESHTHVRLGQFAGRLITNGCRPSKSRSRWHLVENVPTKRSMRIGGG